MIKGVPVRVENVRSDRCSRNGRLWIGAKSIPLHAMCPLLTSASLDLRAYLENRIVYPSDTAHASMVVVRHIDRSSVLEPLLASAGQTALDASPAVLSRQDLLSATPLMIDPCMEYTWYAYCREDLANDPNTPAEIRRLARSMQGGHPRSKDRTPDPNLDTGRRGIYEKFWLGLLRDDSAASSIVSRMLAIQHSWRADVALPPVPAAYDDKLLEVSNKINKIAHAVWPGDNCAHYTILTPDFFANESHIDALADTILSSGAKFNVLKFKNHTLEQVSKVGERDMFRRLLEAINEAKSIDNTRVFALLEAGHAMYPAAAGGLDIVSTKMTGIDYESPGYARGGGGGYGSYYSPKDMTVRKWAEVRKMLAKAGLPCSCEICRKVGPNPTRNEWNLQRRSHYVHCTSRMLADLTRLVDEQKIELAKQRISKSAISNFANSLPYII